jgi:hypothetical protein
MANHSSRRIATIEPAVATGFNRRYATWDSGRTQFPALKNRAKVSRRYAADLCTLFY